jgi:RNA polymerase sigma-70 factor (ECF subfamily)
MRALLDRMKSDETLMQAFQGGDSAAFETLYQRHKDGLYAFLYRSCPRLAVVEELAQDSWMAVVDSAPRYRPQSRFRTWLYRIAHNRVADYWRRRDNRLLSLDQVPDAPAPDIPDTDTGRILAAVGRLPRDQRDALLLREQGFGLTDIAAITGAGVETVKSRLRYGRAALRGELESET